MSVYALLQEGAPVAVHGTGLGGALGIVAWVSIVLAVLALVAVEFIWKDRVPSPTYRWLLLFGLLVLPAFALLGAAGSMFEEMKEVASCNSCHVMNTFVDDMRDPESPTLAARHYRSGAIPGHQCYSCHTGYGIFGTAEAKRDGFRHWLLFVTRTWEEPITFKGSYPNSNCVDCHGAVPAFRDVASHAALAEELQTDAVGCHACHGLPHPSRPERLREAEAPAAEASPRGSLPAAGSHATGTSGRAGTSASGDGS